MIKKVYDISADLFDRYTKWQNLKSNTKAKTRLLYLECLRNLALLDCIAERSGKIPKQEESGILSVISLLETDILELIFMEGKENKDFFKVISRNLTLPINDEDVFMREKKLASGRKEKSVVQWAMFIYIRLSVLKKLAVSKESLNVLKKIQYRTRLKNIKTAYAGIINSLSKEESIKILIS